MLEITPETKLIQFIIKQLLQNKIDKEPPVMDSVDWGKFKDFIIYHELTPFAYIALRDLSSFLPKDIGEFLRNNYYCALVRNQNLQREFLRILAGFNKRNITLVPIKGMALLEDVYSPYPVRLMTDIDLLVKVDNLKEAEEVFFDLGYEKDLQGLKEEYWLNNQCHFTFSKRKKEESLAFVDLHWGIDFKRKGRAILPELWERLRESRLDGQAVKLLSPEDTLFSLVLHSRRFGKPLCAKNILDAILLLNTHPTDFDWDYVLSASKTYGIDSALFFSLYQAKLLFEISMPVYIWNRLNLPGWKKKAIWGFIEKNTFLPNQKMHNKNLYLKEHFFLYDTLLEPVRYILNIPEEQFAKFYNLPAYSKKTHFFYICRLFYIFFKAAFSLINVHKYKTIY